MMMADRDRDKIRYIIFDDYHANAIDIPCYNHVTKIFSKLCINIQKVGFRAVFHQYLIVFKGSSPVHSCSSNLLPSATRKSLRLERETQRGDPRKIFERN